MNCRARWTLFVSTLTYLAATIGDAKCQATTTANIRIVVDYDDMDKKYANRNPSDVEGQKYSFCKQVVISTVKYMQAVLKVKNPTENNTFTDLNLDDQITVIAGKQFTGDIYLAFYVFSDSNGKTLVNSKFQDRAANGRPTSGFLNFNLQRVTPSPANSLNYFGSLARVLMQILVFNTDHFAKYVTNTGTAIGVATLTGNTGTRYFYKYEGEVLKYARTYINDNTIASVLLEDAAELQPSGAWESDFWPNEVGSPVDSIPTLISPLTLYLAVDSGWYTVDNSLLMPQVYGQAFGRKYQDTTKCPGERSPKPMGFCPLSDRGKSLCSPDGLYKTTCTTDLTFNNKCAYLAGTVMCSVESNDYGSDYDSRREILGTSSRCIQTVVSGFSKAMCAKTSCNEAGDITVQYFNGDKCTCLTSIQGATISCGGNSVQCPDATSAPLICASLDRAKQQCPNDCSGRGFCLGLTDGSRTCQCTYGWQGEDCSMANPDEPLLTTAGSYMSLQSSTSSRKSQYWPALLGSALLALHLTLLL